MDYDIGESYDRPETSNTESFDDWNYKGQNYNKEKERYTDPTTGCHFRYEVLVYRLE
jgi:hypothetical protein